MNALHDTAVNSIIITPTAPVDPATFARLRAAGFAWHMSEGAFIASYNDQAHALAAELAGQIETTPPEALQDSGEEWEPVYSPWRHSGWYVSNIHHKGGACGCVSNNYPDKKWRIVCDKRRNGLNEPGDFTFSTRHAAAMAEHELSLREAEQVKDSGEQTESDAPAFSPMIQTLLNQLDESSDAGAPFDSARFYADLLEILTHAGWTHNTARQYFENDRFCMLDNGIGAGDGWSEWRIYINRWNLGNGGGFVPAIIINAEHKTAQQVAAEIIAATMPAPSGDDSTPISSGEQPAKPTPPKIQTVERAGRDGVTRIYLAHLPKGCTELYPLSYSQPGIQAQRIAKLRAAGIAASARGMGIIIDPSGEVPPIEACETLMPGRWIPGGAVDAERIAFDEALGAEVWLTGSTSRPGALAVIAYSGKRTKRDAFYTMPDRERAEQWAAEYIAKRQQYADQIAARNAEKKAKREAGHKLKPGDVLRSSWGYDQTNIDYYEVTQLVGKTMVEIRPIAQQSAESGHMTGECVPRPGHYTGEPMRKAVSDYDGQSVRIASYASAYKIEPREVGGVKVWPVSHWSATH